jgi:uncharacterized protein with von Willebrand factor type A (vWA) domain
MAEQLSPPRNPRLAQNVIHFARALRQAGLPVGQGHVLQALQALRVIDLGQRSDFYWALHACFVTRPDQRLVFAQIFRLFWRDPRYSDHMMSLLLPSVRGTQPERHAKPAEKRAAQALLAGQIPPMPDTPRDEDRVIQVDASQTMSETERLRQMDFEQMSNEEIARAKQMLARLQLPMRPLRSRRLIASPSRGTVDARRSLRQSLRYGGELQQLARATPRERWPDLVVLCDISGSMSQYSRMVLHFLHAVANQKGAGWARVHGFTFGTRLTNITRYLARRDVDAALAAAGAQAQDWEGGTRIGACLRQFNRDWSRRVLGQGAIVLLITDGLERADPALLGTEHQRLQRSARQLIWLNT